ncbi:PhoH family protein [Isosphaera pallida ATCC 43644]|uniref:PhoH-like protein n=1 Tax=Isosphaera pallida (strain ATCC 43644 / DSM 9630 / IS1B) TaxID=575540 RepID=E8QWH9_ISOPI|nr:PhoH family protein [Isosphaera pallida]ADV61871.1 PhoH family protein [Isosphaera pallida ATCC 43644]
MDVIISLESHDEELAVLGSRDQHLRQVRDAFGVKILARHGDLKVSGDQDSVNRALKVFEGLRSTYRRQLPISAGLVAELIDHASPSPLDCLTPSPTSLGFDPLDSRTVDATVVRPQSDSPALQPRVPELRIGSKLIQARSAGQSRYLRELIEKDLVFCVGPAGSGKTYLAVAVAVAMLKAGKIKKLVLVRPAVEAGEHLGFLPGALEDKIHPYLRPLLDALHDLMDFGQIRRYMANDLIEIAPLAYMRGRTLNDAVIILDEGQNTTIPQMKMFLTRMGMNARIVVTGDPTQVDLPPTVASGLADAVRRLADVPRIGVVTLEKSDIVRHPLVQAIVHAYDPDQPQPLDTQSPSATDLLSSLPLPPRNATELDRARSAPPPLESP